MPGKLSGPEESPNGKASREEESSHPRLTCHRHRHAARPRAQEHRRRRDHRKPCPRAERIAIDSYREMINYVGERDTTTKRILEEILAQEEEHADDIADLLAGWIGCARATRHAGQTPARAPHTPDGQIAIPEQR